ncbi:serine/threonine-protein kinase [Chondromyces crocatus]|uniref:Protein kinase n=1 Tax=Chondromyces crocatus TaxID=52 RepID=A0A0K1EGH4_CHOCO|nr:serine/threonine-protein kinase [Chondromyces crocatus]AKT39949.1 protein kinase [Chondromyces crocatus]
MTPFSGTIIADRFRLVRTLGEGGMGSVWLAEHLGLDVPCAVKLIQGEALGSDEVRRRFEREAKIAAQIRSPHVVHILDHGVWEDTPYIAMEFLEGEDLEQRLSRLGRLDSGDVVSIATQVARALSKAHAAGLVHRDLKPANIFLASDDDREIVKVLDFGIAKDVTPTVTSTTKTGALLGTPVYMSPEQAQGVRAVDHRSDLWSLGVVVFECLTGQLPFMSEAFGDLLLKIMVHPQPVPSNLAPVPPGFDAWWARATRREPDLRFQSAKEMAEALNLALGVRGSSHELRSHMSDALRLARSSSLSLGAHRRLSAPPLPPVPSCAGDAVFDATVATPEHPTATRRNGTAVMTPQVPPSERAPISAVASSVQTLALNRPVSSRRRSPLPTEGLVTNPALATPLPGNRLHRLAAGLLLGIVVVPVAAWLLVRSGEPPRAVAHPISFRPSLELEGAMNGEHRDATLDPPSSELPSSVAPLAASATRPTTTARRPVASLPPRSGALATERRPMRPASPALPLEPPVAAPTPAMPPPPPQSAPQPVNSASRKRDPKDFGI